ncbi:MAG: DUF4124 domain-containing protein [Thermodesulfobacteriota bacterium]
MKWLLITLFLLAFTLPANGTTIYKWVDEKGVVNFTDEYKKISPEFRHRVETEEYFEEEVSSPTKIKQEVSTDVQSQDFWMRELDDATANYERARQELLEEGERLVWHRYGGKTQYQMFTVALPSMSERLEVYRERMIEAKAMLDSFKNETQKPEVSGGKRAVSSGTDIYGRDETWWREKVRPWKEQLKEATENYEGASDAFVNELERLGPFRWGGMSLTQYQMVSSRLTGLSGRMTEYQTQISEAKGNLAKLSKEAWETKADPAWLE